MTLESQYTYLEKCKSYQQAGFDVKPRADKFTGFELIRKYYDEKYNTQHGVTFDRLFRKPLEEKFPFPEQYIQMVPASYFPQTV